jgi:hypothetical protein
MHLALAGPVLSRVAGLFSRPARISSYDEASGMPLLQLHFKAQPGVFQHHAVAPADAMGHMLPQLAASLAAIPAAGPARLFRQPLPQLKPSLDMPVDCS